MVAIKSLFSALVATTLISSTSALPVPNTVKDVVHNLNAAANKYTNLDNAIKAFDGHPAQYTAITKKEAAVEVSLHRAIDAAHATAPLSDEDSKFVMQALAKPYPTFMGDLLADIVAKESQVKEIGKSDDMLRILNNLSVLSSELPNALEKIVDAKDAEEIDGGEKWVQGLFADAIKAYSQ
ncbi:cell wall mannoprotein 1 family protein [Aspergillus fischeri NRRL 181]|uniref:Cell wall protein, putative n=1 Tax=Neosartorya fischeri (strain ATCC 1020 / DSM 3700 / CBS 544.65 / FGSC A1164 / JCM 1740 / NRRL 181 / WB 181) TaxID=331117 RepID=A1DJG1_NEOFI|nr:cell wall protein, putative [Aspergillus fischeri NRRL 181]EAW16850.1 cell wall protein, putative [Aspergillus fischeri NRRL 181]KAG2001152.1 hypothetical protein GB937_010429 [Aspergillus fischeri]